MIIVCDVIPVAMVTVFVLVAMVTVVSMAAIVPVFCMFVSTPCDSTHATTDVRGDSA